ncbi:hypothetical protein [Acinetobacter proteolyticus]|uniref:hypothetical protein n=1 Tax=Acinetobacter proteolyticus TaxID=1776741 RepID=UPI0031E0198F
MVASTDIKFYVHTNTNAPQLQNAFGCMIDVLDGCLVNGFGSQTVSTLTASGTTITATFGTAHNFMMYQVIKIAGANQTEFNGEFRILTVPNSNTITFQLAASPSVTTVTGIITCSLPPIGWLKPFSAAGKAAYRSSNISLPSRPYLRVVDAMDPAYTATYAKFAKVGIVEDMSDIDTMFGTQAPFDSSLPDKNWIGSGSANTGINGWAKWHYANFSLLSQQPQLTSTPANGNRNWVLVGNKDYFYIFPTSTIGDTNSYATYGFGHFKSLLLSDLANVFLSCHPSYAANNASMGVAVGLTTYRQANSLLLYKNYLQSSNYATGSTISLYSSNVTGASNMIGAYSLTAVAPFGPIYIIEDTNNVLRGEIPNLYWLYQIKPYSNLQQIEKDGVIYMVVNTFGTGGSQGQLVVKIGDL